MSTLTGLALSVIRGCRTQTIRRPCDMWPAGQSPLDRYINYEQGRAQLSALVAGAFVPEQ